GREADAEPFQAGAEFGAEIGHGQVDGRWVGRVVAGDRVEDEGAIARGPGQGPGVVERPVQGYDATDADPAVGGLDAGDAAEGGGNADATARVGAEGAEAKAGGNCRAGAAARPAGDPVQVPGVVGRREVGVDVRPAKGPFVHIELAEENG